MLMLGARWILFYNPVILKYGQDLNNRHVLSMIHRGLSVRLNLKNEKTDFCFQLLNKSTVVWKVNLSTTCNVEIAPNDVLRTAMSYVSSSRQQALSNQTPPPMAASLFKMNSGEGRGGIGTPDQSLNCPLCHHHLKNPRVLPSCLHSFCLDCLQIHAGQNRIFHCPICRQVNFFFQDTEMHYLWFDLTVGVKLLFYL